MKKKKEEKEADRCGPHLELNCILKANKFAYFILEGCLYFD